MNRALVLCVLAITFVVAADTASSADKGDGPGLELAFLWWSPASTAMTFEGFDRNGSGLTCRGFELSSADEQRIVEVLPTGGKLLLVSHQIYGDRAPGSRRAIVVLHRQIDRPEPATFPLPVSDSTVIYVQGDAEGWLIDPDVSFDRHLVLRPSRDKRSLLFEVELESGQREEGVAWNADSRAGS